MLYLILIYSNTEELWYQLTSYLHMIIIVNHKLQSTNVNPKHIVSRSDQVWKCLVSYWLIDEIESMDILFRYLLLCRISTCTKPWFASMIPSSSPVSSLQLQFYSSFPVWLAWYPHLRPFHSCSCSSTVYLTFSLLLNNMIFLVTLI